MKRIGTSYGIQCTQLATGDVILTESFKSLVNSNGKIRVAFTSGCSGNALSSPYVKRRGGVLEPLTPNTLDATLNSRLPIYFRIDDIFSIVEVKGEYDQETESWSPNTSVSFYTPKGVMLIDKTPYCILEPMINWNSVQANIFSVGNNIVTSGISEVCTYPEILLRAIKHYIDTKRNFYLARVGGE